MWWEVVCFSLFWKSNIHCTSLCQFNTSGVFLLDSIVYSCLTVQHKTTCTELLSSCWSNILYKCVWAQRWHKNVLRKDKNLWERRLFLQYLILKYGLVNKDKMKTIMKMLAALWAVHRHSGDLSSMLSSLTLVLCVFLSYYFLSRAEPDRNVINFAGF